MSAATEHTAPTGHHALSPSKFPAWEQCPCFESGPAGEAAEHGGMLHERLARHLHGRGNPFEGLETEDRESLEWAAEQIRELCEGAASGGIEERLTYRHKPKGKPFFFGTADVVAYGPDNSAILIDFKSGEVRDHRAQVAGYAAALMSEHPEVETVTAWLLFGRYRRAISHTFTRAEAVELVESIIARRTDPQRTPAPCDYCAWCAERMTCPALNARAVAVAEHREDWRGELPAEWHASQITNPEQMARALTLAKFVTEWADAVKHHATELAKGGVEIPGFKLQERRGRKEISDIAEAWNLIEGTIEQPAFLRCCSLSIPKLADAVATAAGIPKARAEREVSERLAPVTIEGKPSVSLVKDRTAGKEAA
jgi:hypothetical protein